MLRQNIEVLRVQAMKGDNYFHLTACSLVESYQNFGGNYSLPFQG
jgi:hypothetical protein